MSHIQRRTNPPSQFIVLLFMLKHADVLLWLRLLPPPPPPPKKKKKKKKEDAVLLSNWNIKFQVTTTFWILSYVQRRTRPPSEQRYRHILNSYHKQVVHVCWQKKIPESEPWSEEDESSFKYLCLITQKVIMSWLKFRKQRGWGPPIKLKYLISGDDFL